MPNLTKFGQFLKFSSRSTKFLHMIKGLFDWEYQRREARDNCSGCLCLIQALMKSLFFIPFTLKSWAPCDVLGTINCWYDTCFVHTSYSCIPHIWMHEWSNLWLKIFCFHNVKSEKWFTRDFAYITTSSFKESASNKKSLNNLFKKK